MVFKSHCRKDNGIDFATINDSFSFKIRSDSFN